MKEKLSDLSYKDIFDADFVLYEGNPIVKNFGLSFVAADPSLLTPDDSPTGQWHLFCHTFEGIYRLDSDDGVTFGKPHKICARAMRPNINAIDGRYFLFYERTRTLLGNALTLLGGKWKSEIYLTQSCDLVHWTEPKPIIRQSRPFEKDKYGQMISNPFLLREGDVFKLYYSCGQTFIKDCGFTEPKYISYAKSKRIWEDYISRSEPIIAPDPNSEYFNLCSGCLKVYKLSDCYIGLQNGIFQKEGKSHSAILLLRSDDGDNFEFGKALLSNQMQGDNDWMAQYVYASHLVFFEGELRLYFNARNTSNALKGREGIGFCSAKIGVDNA